MKFRNSTYAYYALAGATRMKSNSLIDVPSQVASTSPVVVKARPLVPHCYRPILQGMED